MKGVTEWRDPNLTHSFCYNSRDPSEPYVVEDASTVLDYIFLQLIISTPHFAHRLPSLDGALNITLGLL